MSSKSTRQRSGRPLSDGIVEKKKRRDLQMKSRALNERARFGIQCDKY